jgi:hypothetical protein
LKLTHPLTEFLLLGGALEFGKRSHSHVRGNLRAVVVREHASFDESVNGPEVFECRTEPVGHLALTT